MNNFFIDTHNKWKDYEFSDLLIAEEVIPPAIDRIMEELAYLDWLAANRDSIHFVLSGDAKVNAIPVNSPELLFNLIKAKTLNILNLL